jgi:hypothetical protein
MTVTARVPKVRLLALVLPDAALAATRRRPR